MNTMNMPGFTAEAPLCTSANYYRDHASSNSLSYKDAIISPAYRVRCGSNTGLSAYCSTTAAVPFFWPCWWNSGCIFAHVVVTSPWCAGCTLVD
jgi:hypothetical protein